MTGVGKILWEVRVVQYESLYSGHIRSLALAVKAMLIAALHMNRMSIETQVHIKNYTEIKSLCDTFLVHLIF